jgi:alginate O-acetyltransferase complex protein AlgI
VLLVYCALRNLDLRNAVLLVASLFFYAWGEQGFVLLLLTSIGLNHVFGIWIDRWRARPSVRFVVGAAVAANLMFLGAFKYANFLADNWNALFGAFLPRIEIDPVHLPLGISFFTFQALTYVIDIYRGEAPAQRGLLRTALYISLFPQLVAGPIVRYHTIAARLAHRVVTRSGFAEGVRRFVIGLGKKVLLANGLAVPADAIFAIPDEALTFELAWAGVLCYTLQIYFDFSGYSDMAIGLGRMFGFRFPENFQYPYASRSIREFWRRWHISLSSWFRDYLYIPMGGSRVSPLRTQLNLLAVFFLCGLWHGASWNFVVWGLFHGCFLAAERSAFGRWLDRAWRPLRHAYVLLVVVVGWVFFRAETLPQALAYLGAMAGLGAGDGVLHHLGLHLSPEVVVWWIAGCAGATPLVAAAARRAWQGLARSPAPLATPTAALTLGVVLGAVLLASAASLAAGIHNPFIYFRF